MLHALVDHFFSGVHCAGYFSVLPRGGEGKGQLSRIYFPPKTGTIGNFFFSLVSSNLVLLYVACYHFEASFFLGLFTWLTDLPEIEASAHCLCRVTILLDWSINENSIVTRLSYTSRMWTEQSGIWCMVHLWTRGCRIRWHIIYTVITVLLVNLLGLICSFIVSHDLAARLRSTVAYNPVRMEWHP